MTPSQTHEACRRYGISDYTLNADGTGDVDGNVDLNSRGLARLPLRFGKVSGDFRCAKNRLKTLEGAPSTVGGHFDCHLNLLTTLVGAPVSVLGVFNCHDNKLTTLEGVPMRIGVDLICRDNPFEIIRKLFPHPHTKKFLEAYREWDFFAGGNKIHRHRLKEALADYGKELPESIPGYDYLH